LGNINKEN